MKYEYHRRTLEDRVKGKVEYGKNLGPPTVLIKERKRMLVAYLIHTAKQGFSLTPKMTTAFA